MIFEAFYSLPDKAGYQGFFSEEGVLEKRIFNLYPASGSFWQMEYYPDGSLRTERFRFSPYDITYTFFIDGSVNSIKHHTAYPKENLDVTLNPQGQLERGTLHGKDLKEHEMAAISPYVFNPGKSEFYRGKEDGGFEASYKNGLPRIKGSLNDKLLDGELVLFRPSGDTLGYFHFDDALLEGENYMLGVDGDTIIKSFFAEGKLRERYQRHPDGAVEILKYDSLGSQSYSFKIYADGTPQLLEDRENGIYKSWQEDGTLMSHTRPVKDKDSLILNESFHKNGQLSRKYYRKNDKDHGEYVEYYESGQLNTRCHFREGTQHGPYVSYFEDGSLRSKGEIVEGKKQGEWALHRDGKLQEVYFKNGKEQIKAPETACACIDTSIANGTYSFLNSVSGMLGYKQFKSFNFDFVEALDSSSYHALFFKGMGRLGEGAHTVPLLSYSQLRIPFHQAGSTSLLLNSCHTPGFITSINFHYRYISQRPEQREFWFREPKLRLELENTIFQQVNAPGKLYFSFEPERLVFDQRDKLTVMPRTSDFCFEEIKIGEWALVSGKGDLLFERVLFPQIDTSALPPLPGGMQRRAPEVPGEIRFLTKELLQDTTTGLKLTNSLGYFAATEGRLSWASHNLWITEKWSGGTFTVDCEKIEEGDMLTMKSPEGKTFSLSMEGLKAQLQQSGLENLELVRLANQDKIRIEFLNHQP